MVYSPIQIKSMLFEIFLFPEKLDVRSFLGLANYYRRFIKNFANIAGPLTAFLRKNVKFQWTAGVSK